MFVWQNGTISDLTGANYAGYLFNKRGDMVGWRQPYTSGYQELVWRQGIFEPTGLRFAPTDFNDRDQILTQNVPQKWNLGPPLSVGQRKPPRVSGARLAIGVFGGIVGLLTDLRALRGESTGVNLFVQGVIEDAGEVVDSLDAAQEVLWLAVGPETATSSSEFDDEEHFET